VTEVTWSILRTARHRDASGDNLPLGSRPSRQPLLSGSTPSDGLPAHGNYNLRLGAEVWLVGGVRSPEYPRPASAPCRGSGFDQLVWPIGVSLDHTRLDTAV